MEDISFFILWAFSTWAVYNFVTGLIDGYRDEQINELKARINALVHVVNSEIHGETVYWFDQDNGEFLGQGKNPEEIIKILKQRFPDHLFYLHNGEQDKGYLLAEATEWKIKPVEVDK